MRFRKDKIGVVSDIRKAFLQISVSKEDCDSLRFLWWEDFEKRPMKVFRHRRVVFGLTCSPFLLAVVLNNLIENALIEMQETADILRRSFYVDNSVTFLPTEERMIAFIHQSKHLLESGRFDLRGWEHSNFYEIKNSEKPISVLGLQWDKNEYTLFCDIQSVEESKKNVTKRNILSTVNKIFDPLGFLCPVTDIPKLIVQQIWNLKIGWDAELPEEIQNKFEVWIKDLELLSSVKIPRCLDVCQPNLQISLHVFMDTSKLAYSAVVFLKAWFLRTGRRQLEISANL
ncbi:uncharacterized protein [Parasteatoda tepidariorum]|uniref:uncharacterized protein n=1 Tax=Parasteatoda tepidariorum TaxID=114398 RepID=UPI0039BC29D2